VAGSDARHATAGWRWPAILDLLVQICRALAYIHSRHVTHSDLKPSNVMVSPTGAVKLLDFGLAGARMGWITGTPPYIAPEKLTRGAIDHRADLYSLGVLAAVLLRGGDPSTRTTPTRGRDYRFAGDHSPDAKEHSPDAKEHSPDAKEHSPDAKEHSPDAKEHSPDAGGDSTAVGSGPWRPFHLDATARAHLPTWLVEVVERLCAPDPADRFPSANAMIEAVSQAGERTYAVQTPETRQSYLLSSRLVGRDPELSHVRAHVDGRLRPRERSTVAPLLLLEGESGVGKSRLLREVRHGYQLSGVTVIRASLREEAQDELAAPATALTHVVRLARATGRPDLLQRYGPELKRLLPARAAEEITPAAGEPVSASSAAGTVAQRAQASAVGLEIEQRRLFERLAAFLMDLADHTPYLLCFEDLQWARPATLDLLSRLLHAVAARQEAGAPVRLALLGTFRVEELGPALEGFLRQGETGGAITRLPLAPLRGEHVSQLLRSMLGGADLPADLVARVARETAGNPFFVEEVLRTLVEQEVIRPLADRWTATAPVQRLEIPSSVVEVLQRRLHRLDPTARRLLELLAVVGRPAGLGLLQRASQRTAQTLHDDLQRLEERQMALLVPGDAPRYDVAHPRLREVGLAALSPERRQHLHRRVGEALEGDDAPPSPSRLYALSQHFREAGPDPTCRRKALRYSLEAAEHARRRYAPAQTVECLAYACAQIARDDPDDPRLPALRETLGEAYTLQGSYELALARYAEAAAGMDEPVAQARLQRKVAEVYIQQDRLTAAHETLWRAVERLGERRPPPGVPQALVTARELGDHLLLRLAPRRVRPATRPGERQRLSELSLCHLRLCYVYHFLEPTATALPALRAHRHAQRLGPSEALSLADSILGHLYGVAGRFADAHRYGREALALARQGAWPWHEATARSRQGILYYLQGRWREAEQSLTIAQAQFEQYGDLFELGTCETHIFACRLNQGRYRAAAEAAERMDALLRQTGEMHFLSRGVQAQRLYADALLGERSLAEAVAGLTRAIREAQTARDHVGLGVFHLWCADLQRLQGDPVATESTLEAGLRARAASPVRLDYDVAVHPLLALARVELLLRGEPTTKAHGSPTDRRRALQPAEQQVRVARRLSRRRHPNYRSLALLSDAVIRWVAGHRVAARRRFDESRAVARLQGARAWEGRSWLEEGRCQAEAAVAPDAANPAPAGEIREAARARARHCLQMAIRCFRACEALPDEALARERLAALDAPAEPAR
jgi:tetratricopeptide (TPR) repeat protein